LRLLRFRASTFLGVALCLGFSGLQARDYEVKLRLLNGKTGQPIANREVHLWLIYQPPGPRGLETELMRGRTSADGVANFWISEPLPKDFAFGGDSDLLTCSSGPPIPADKLLQHGVVAKNLCDKKGKLKGKIVAKPGEAVAFAVPKSWWRRLIPIQ